MCGCPDNCRGNDACGCEGKSARFIDEQLTLLMNKQLAMRRNFIAALGAKAALTATEAELATARELIDSEHREMEKIMEGIRTHLGNKCIEMRVALGGTRE